MKYQVQNKYFERNVFGVSVVPNKYLRFKTRKLNNLYGINGNVQDYEQFSKIYVFNIIHRYFLSNYFNKGILGTLIPSPRVFELHIISI